MARVKDKKYGRIWTWLSLLSLLLSILVTSIFPSIAYASPNTNSNNSVKLSLSWVNECDVSGTLTATNGFGTRSENLSFTVASCIQDYNQWSNSPGGGNGLGYYEYFDQASCSPSNIYVSSANPQYSSHGQIYYRTPGPDGSCIPYNFSQQISLGNQSNADIVYAFSSKSTITRVDGASYYTFTESSSNSNDYILNGPGCQDMIVLSGKNSGNLWELSTGSGPNMGDPNYGLKAPSNVAPGCYVSYWDDDINGPYSTQAGGNTSGSLICTTNGGVDTGFRFTFLYCSQHKQNSNGSFTLHLGGVSNLSKSSGGGSGNTSASSSPPICESSSWSLSWIACSVINEAANIETALENNIINPMLQTQTLSFSSKDCSNPNAKDRAQSCIFSVWSNMRIYANILFIIVLLVVVISEAAGGGLIDAYSVRKILPRLLAAAILINLSIYLVAALLDIFNVLGVGIFSLLEAPFKGAGVWHITLGGFSGGLLGGLLSGGGIATILAVATGHGKDVLDLAIGLLFMFALPLVLSVLGVIATLMFRTALLYLLVMLSPIAFALYTLPNTEKYFRQWWKLLLETLMVYPIVGVVFAMSDISAVIFNSMGFGASGTGNWLGELVSAAAMVAPLFLIPFAFRFAGDTMKTIHGAVSAARNKAHAGIKGDPRDPNSLQNRMKLRRKAAMSEMGVSGAQIGAMLNPAGGSLKSRLSAIESRRNADRAKYGAMALEHNALWNDNKNDEKFLKAVANRSAAVDEMKSATDPVTKEAWRRAITASDQIAGNAAVRSVAQNAWFASGYAIPKGVAGYNQVSETVSRNLGIDDSAFSIGANGDRILDPTKTNKAGAYAAEMNKAQYVLRNAGLYHLGGINNGTGYDPENGLSKADPYTIAVRAKPEDIEAKGEAMERHIKAALGAGIGTPTYDIEMEKARVHHLELNAIKESAKGANRDAALKILEDINTTSTVTGNSMATELDNWAKQPIPPPSPGVKAPTRKVRVTYDPSNPAHQLWTQRDINLKYKFEDRPITKDEIARDKATGLRIPNPTELDK